MFVQSHHNPTIESSRVPGYRNRNADFSTGGNIAKQDVHNTKYGNNGQSAPLAPLPDYRSQSDQPQQYQNTQRQEQLQGGDNQSNPPEFFNTPDSESSRTPESVIKAMNQSRRPKKPSSQNKQEERPLPKLIEAEGTRAFAWDLFKVSN